MQEAGELAKNTAILMNVSEFDNVNEATEALISSLQAFGYEASNSIEIVDKLNIVGNNFAISSDGIASGLQRSASTLVAAGNSLEQSIAMIAAGNKVQQDPEGLGNALKVLSMRIRGTKTELEDMGESTEGMVENTSKLQAQVKALTNVDGNGGVDILKDDGSFRSTYDILLDIAEVWDRINETDPKNQAALLEILAGKTRGSQLASILQNPKDLKEAYEMAKNSAGSAMAENEKYLDSIQGKIDQFNNSLQTMWMNTINSDSVKLIVDAGNGLVKIIDKLGIINTLVAGIISKFAFSNNSSFGNFFTGKITDMHLGDWGKSIENSTKGIGGFFSKLFDKESVDAFSQATENAANSVEMIGEYAVDANGQLNLFTNATNAQTGASTAATTSNIANAASEKAVGAAATTASVGVQLLNAALSMGLSLLVGFAVGAIVKGLDYLINHVEKLKEEVNELTETYKNAKKEFSENLEILIDISSEKTLEGMIDEFHRLTQGVDKNGNRMSLTAEQYAKYLEYCKEIVKLNPSLVEGYENAARAIGNNASVIDDVIAKQKQEQQKNASEYTSADNLKKLGKNAGNTYKDAYWDWYSYIDHGGAYGYYGISQQAYDLFSFQYDKGKNYKKDYGDKNSSADDLAKEILESMGITDVDEKLKKYYNKYGNYDSMSFFKDYASMIADNKEKIIESIQSNENIDVDDTIIADFRSWADAIKQSEKNLEEASKGLIEPLLAVPEKLSQTENLTDASKAFITEWIKSNENFLIDFGNYDQSKKNIEAYEKEVINMVNNLANNKDAQKLLDNIYSVDINTIKFSDYQKLIQDNLNQFYNEMNIAEDQREAITVRMGFDFAMDEGVEDGSTLKEFKEYASEVLGREEEDVTKWLSSLPAATVKRLVEFDWQINGHENLTEDEMLKMVGVDTFVIPPFVTKSYDDLKQSIEAVNNVISEMSTVIADNTEITQEQYDAIVALGASETDLAMAFDTTNGYVVKNADALKRILSLAKNNVASQTTLARAQARLKYLELSKQMQSLKNETGKYNVEQKNQINLIAKQMDSLQKLIGKYSALETMLLGVKHTFDEFREAQQFDEEIDFTDDLTDATVELIKAYQTGKLDTQAARAARDLMVPQEVIESAKDYREELQMASEYLRNEHISKYISVEYDDDKNVSSAEITTGNTLNFLDDMLEVGLFEGTRNNFTVKKDINNITEALEYLRKNGIELTETAFLTFLENLDGYTLEKGSLLGEFLGDNLDYQLQTARQEIAELDKQLANGQTVDPQKYAEAQANLQKVQQQAADVALQFKDINDKISENEEKTEEYTNKIKEGSGNEVDESTGKTYSELLAKTLEERTALIKEKQELENKYGVVTEYTTAEALESYGITADNINEKLADANETIGKIVNYTEENGERKYDSGTLQYLQDTLGIITEIDDNGDVKMKFNLDPDNEAQKTFKEVHNLQDTDEIPIDTVMDYEGLKPAEKQELANLKRASDIQNLIKYDMQTNGLDTANQDVLTFEEAVIEIGKLSQKVYNFMFDQDGKLSTAGKSIATMVENLTNIVNIASKPINFVFGGLEKAGNAISGLFGGRGDVDGTAHVNGTAYTTGSWGIKQSETSLVGELGPELLVRNGRWTLVGENGAEFTDVKKDDIIFNHKQTESLLKNGYVTSRGKAYVGGKAFEPGQDNHSIYIDEVTVGNLESGSIASNPDENFGNQSPTGDSNLDDIKDDAEQLIDFIEYKLENIEKSIAKSTSKIENMVDNTSQTVEKNSEYTSKVRDLENKRDTYGAAKNYYAQKANELYNKIDPRYQGMAKNGAIAIEDFIGEDEGKIAEAIEKFREMYNKQLDAENGELEAIAEISATRLEQFNDIADDYDNVIDLAHRRNDSIQAQMDFVEESGGRLSSKFYDALIEGEKQSQEELKKKRKDMQSILDDAVKTGDVKVGSNDWYEMTNAIYDVDDAIQECELSIEEFNNAIIDLKWDNFDKLMQRFEDVADEIDFLYDLIADDEEVVDEFGNWTTQGAAALGLIGEKIDYAKKTLSEYNEKIKENKNDLESGAISEDEYYERLRDLNSERQDAVKMMESEKRKLVDLTKTRVAKIKEGIDKEIEAYDELINKKKEELNMSKQAHDFANTVEEKRKNIAELEKRLAILQLDNSAKAAAERKRIEEELSNAKKDIEETMYQHSVEQQQTALDKNAEQFKEEKEKEKEAWDEYLLDIDTVVSDAYGIIESNAEEIGTFLVEKAGEYGITLNEAIVAPWNEGSNAIGSYEDKVNAFGSAFIAQLDKIKAEQEKIIENSNKIANDKISTVDTKQKETTSAKPAPTPTPPSKPSTPTQTQPERFSDGQKVRVKKGVTKFSTQSGSKTMQSWVPGSEFVVMQDNIRGDYSQVLIGRNGGYTGWVWAKDLERYAKGSKAIDKDQIAMLDELGEELVLNAGPNGRLQFLSKGSGVVPSDLTERLMEWGELDPTQVLNNSKPQASMPGITTNNIDLSLNIAEVIHIEHADNNSIPNITKAVQDQMDKYMANINKKLYNRVR